MNSANIIIKTLLIASTILLLANDIAVAQNKGSYERVRNELSIHDAGWQNISKFKDIEGFADKPETIHEFSVSLNPPKLGTFGNQCAISGTLKFRKQESDEPTPVNWFQGASIYLHHKPKEDMEEGVEIDFYEIESDDVLLSNNGAFSVEFDLRETDRDPSKDQEFEVIILLANHRAKKGDASAQTIFWDSENPQKLKVVEAMTIPASPKISPELRLINDACRWPFYDHDARKLIRAVNALQPLGQEKALAILTEYVDLNDENESYDDHEIVFWIIQLLFEPVDLQDQTPSPAVAVFILNDSREDNPIHWPFDPLEIVEGIPFMVGQKIASSGVPTHPYSLINWVRKYGVIRDSQIVPSGNPLLAAKKLMATEKFAEIKESWGHKKIRWIRDQAVATLGLELKEDEYGYEKLDDEEWTQFLNSDSTQMKWDAATQEFKPPRTEK